MLPRAARSVLTRTLSVRPSCGKITQSFQIIRYSPALFFPSSPGISSSWKSTWLKKLISPARLFMVV